MDRDAILDKVREVMLDIVTLDSDVELNEDTQFKSLDIDSFDMLEIISTLEDDFDLSFDTDDLDKIVTIGDAVDAIEGAQ